MIENIAIVVPEKTIELEYFLKILSLCTNATIFNHNCVLLTSNPTLKPTISFVSQPTTDPSLSFTGEGLGTNCFHVGKLPLGFNPDQTIASVDNPKKPFVATQSDKQGEYLRVKFPFATYYQLSFKQLYHRLAGKLVFLDHVGVDINPRLLPKTRYDILKRIVAGSSCLYNFPFGKEWPFIIPASPSEQKREIKPGMKLHNPAVMVSPNSSAERNPAEAGEKRIPPRSDNRGLLRRRMKRDPKFEFVYDFRYPYPEIQLDIQTSLTPKETLALFPPPYGYYDPNPTTGDYCSSVFIYTGWANVSLRIDARFHIPNFSLTDWLLDKGSRAK